MLKQCFPLASLMDGVQAEQLFTWGSSPETNVTHALCHSMPPYMHMQASPSQQAAMQDPDSDIHVEQQHSACMPSCARVHLIIR